MSLLVRVSFAVVVVAFVGAVVFVVSSSLLLSLLQLSLCHFPRTYCCCSCCCCCCCCSIVPCRGIDSMVLSLLSSCCCYCSSCCNYYCTVPRYRIDSMLHFRFMESITRRCNKINKRRGRRSVRLMRYFRIVVAVAAAAAAAALTVRACFTGMYGLIVPYHTIKLCHRLLLCFAVFLWMMWINKSTREKYKTYRIITRCTVKHSTTCTYWKSTWKHTNS